MKQAEELRRIPPTDLLSGGMENMSSWATNEWAGPCPLPGCTSTKDGFHVKQFPDGWKWTCHTCHPGKWGSAIDLAMVLHNVDLIGAMKMLSEMGGLTLAQWTPPEPTAPEWDSKEWQIKAKRRLFAARDLLPKETWRGLDHHTLQAFEIRFGPAWCPQTESKIEAAWIPWKNRKITAVQIRYLSGEHRYSAIKGSERLVFGAHLIDPQKRDFLWVVEGEINAMSVWQETRSQATDVISIGPATPGSRSLEVARVIVAKYPQAAVWCDRLSDAEEIATRIGAKAAFTTDSTKDANDLLQEGENALWEAMQVATLWW